MARPEYSEFSAALISETYSEAVNVLPDIRDTVQDGITTLDWNGFEAAITGIEIRSDSAFEVQFNSNTILSSQADGAEYFVHFDGSIDYVVFTESTTVTYIWAAYFRQAAQHVTVTLASEPSGADMVLKNWTGEVLPPADTNEYECNIFLPYIAVAEGSGIYVDTEALFRAKDTTTVVVKRDVSKLVSIAVTTPPTKTNYYDGDTLDMTGIEVTATLENGETEDVTSDCVFRPEDGAVLSVGDTSVLIYYTDINGISRATAQAIVVAEIELSSIAVTTAPTKTAYTTGEELTMAGLEITATMNNGDTETVAYGAEGLSYSPAEGTVITESGNVTITYTDGDVSKTATQAITFS